MLPIIPSDVDWSFILVAFVWSIWPAQEMLLMMCDVWLPFFLQCPSSPLLKLLFLAVRYWLCCLLLSYHASLDWSALPEVLCCWLMFLILLLVRCELLDIPILPSWVWRASYSVALVASVGGCALVSGALILKGDGICCIKCWKAMAVWCSQGSTWTRE